MDADRLRRHATAVASGLTAAELSHPFGPEWDVWKVRGRVFLLQTVLDDEPLVTVKADPVDARMLCEALPEVSPGYHMNKKHWITLRGGANLDADLVSDLVTDSYLLVVERLPRAQRPVIPERFSGRR